MELGVPLGVKEFELEVFLYVLRGPGSPLETVT